MSRSTSVDTDKIVKAARSAFLKYGIKAKTAEVAKLAGVSEGSIFLRFKTKEALFRAAMQAEDNGHDWLGVLANGRDRPVDDVMIDFGRRCLAHFRGTVPLAMMEWSNPKGGAGAGNRRSPRAPSRADALSAGIDRLATYLKDAQVEGRLGPCDTAAAARLFVYGCWARAATDVLGQGAPGEPADDESYLRSFMDLFVLKAQS
jgi:AcrR family transcriptional regulator